MVLTPQNLKQVINKKLQLNLDIKSRQKHITEARSIYCFLLRSLFKMQYIHIAETLDCIEHHATIINSIKRFKEWHDTDKDFKEKFNDILKLIYSIDKNLISNNVQTGELLNADKLFLENQLSGYENTIIDLSEKLKRYDKFIDIIEKVPEKNWEEMYQKMVMFYKSVLWKSQILK